MNPFTESTVAQPLADGPYGKVHTATLGLDVAKPPAILPGAAADLGACSRLKQRSAQASHRSGPALPAARHKRKAGALLMYVLATGAIAGNLLFWPGVSMAIDVNQASAEQLKGVRGIGPRTAQIIVEERARGGRYESFSDLSDRVKGIGPKKAASMRSSGLTIGSQAEGGRETAKAPDAAASKKGR